jgi:hypothetical protein
MGAILEAILHTTKVRDTILLKIQALDFLRFKEKALQPPILRLGVSFRQRRIHSTVNRGNPVMIQSATAKLSRFQVRVLPVFKGQK